MIGLTIYLTLEKRVLVRDLRWKLVVFWQVSIFACLFVYFFTTAISFLAYINYPSKAGSRSKRHALKNYPLCLGLVFVGLMYGFDSTKKSYGIYFYSPLSRGYVWYMSPNENRNEKGKYVKQIFPESTIRSNINNRHYKHTEPGSQCPCQMQAIHVSHNLETQ